MFRFSFLTLIKGKYVGLNRIEKKRKIKSHGTRFLDTGFCYFILCALWFGLWVAIGFGKLVF